MERPTEVVLRPLNVTSTQGDDPEILVRGRVRRVDLQHLVELPDRLLQPARIRQRNAEGIEHLGIVLGRQWPENLHRFLRLPVLAQNQPQPFAHAGVRGSVLDGLPQCLGRLSPLLPFLKQEREHLAADCHVGTSLDDLPRNPEGVFTPAMLVRVDDLVQHRVELHEILRVIGRGIGLLALRPREISETQQICALLRRDVAVDGACRAGGRCRERIADLEQDPPLLVREIRRFARIALQIVQLDDRQIDVLPVLSHQTDERSPTAVERCGERLEVQIASIGRTQERPAGIVPLDGEPQAIENRRHDVDVSDERVAAGRPHPPRLPDHHRDGESRFVGEEPVGELTMIAEGFSVIGGDDEKWLVRIENRRQKAQHRLVRRRDLAVILAAGLRRHVRVLRRRIVGSVGIVEVNPHETRSPRGPCPPLGRRGQDLSRGTFGDDELRGCRPFTVTVIVGIESLLQAVALIERIGSDEGPGGVTLLAQDLRDRDGLIRECESCVVPNAVLVRKTPREDVGVRRKSHDVVRVCVREEKPFTRQTIEERRRRRASGIRGSISPERVDRDQDDVGAIGRRIDSILTTAGEQHEEKNECENFRERRHQGKTIIADGRVTPVGRTRDSSLRFGMTDWRQPELPGRSNESDLHLVFLQIEPHCHSDERSEEESR